MSPRDDIDRYDFGGGSIADMGNYSLWPIFMALDLPVLYSIEAQSRSSVEVHDQASTVNVNDFAFPYANRVCFKFGAHGRWPALKLYWLFPRAELGPDRAGRRVPEDAQRVTAGGRVTSPESEDP